MLSCVPRCVCVAVVLGATFSVARGQSADDLLPYVPGNANSIAVLKLAELKASPRGRKEGWAEKHETEFLAGSITVPPWVDLLVRASHVRPGSRHRDWTVMLVPLPEKYEMTALAQREGTEVQPLSDHNVVFSPRHGGYFVELKSAAGTRTLGGMAPAGRQEVSQWIAGAGTGPNDYLQTAAKDDKSQLILALDMRDMLEPSMVRFRLDGAEALKGESGARTALTIDFQTIQGIQLRVQVEETATAEIQMDFGRVLGDESRYIKPLLIEFLNDAGAALDELEEATSTARGRSVTLKMPLSDESLRRILSLITAPPPPTDPQTAASSTTTPPPPDAEPTGSRIDLAASRRYFKAVNQNVDDLQRAYSRASSYSRTAQWHVNFAERIDHLPKAGVDPALLDYGITIRERLLALAASLRGTAVQIDALDNSVVYNVDVQPAYATGFDWWWGGAYTVDGYYGPTSVNVTSNLQDVRAQQAQVVQASSPDRDQIWQMIVDERATVERAMVDKYGAEFQSAR